MVLSAWTEWAGVGEQTVGLTEVCADPHGVSHSCEFVELHLSVLIVAPVRYNFSMTKVYPWPSVPAM